MSSEVETPTPAVQPRNRQSLRLSKRASRLRRFGSLVGRTILFLIAAASAVAVFFIFYFIAKDSIPFFWPKGQTWDGFFARISEFIFSNDWYPSRRESPTFGAAALFVGSALVTLGAVLVAVPLGVAAAICLSDILPFNVRQIVKPVIEILAALPSVAFGFFALVIFAPILQEHGGTLLSVAAWVIGIPLAFLVIMVVSDLAASLLPDRMHLAGRWTLFTILGLFACLALSSAAGALAGIRIDSGTNALNVSIILGIMALPTVVSVSEDALQAVGRELREGSYALGATRAETLIKVVIPAAASGIGAAVILGIMRAIGETMVVWMASGNASQIPSPWFNFLQPVRTLTATIAGDMGEADHVTGSDRYHVLFALALCLLAFCFICNLVSEWAVRRTRKKLAGG